MSVRRSADPVCLQYIWNAIEADPDGSIGSSFASILSAIQSNCDSKLNASRLQAELSNAVRDGCIQAHQDKYRLVDGFENIKRDGKDWYCFECHGPGLVVPCPTCFRVYHPDCISAACESHWSCRLPVEDPTVGTQTELNTTAPPSHPCPVCKRLQRVLPVGSDSASVKDLQKIFSVALDCIRNRVHWKTMQKVGYLFEPLRNEYLVYQQINTKLIADRLRADPRSDDGYQNRTSLLVDLDTLVHNAAVFYGSKHIISNMARQIRSQLKRAMRESTYCIDCYIRPSTLSSHSRMTAACRKPHRLLWFQHNGWSFRPCKMLYESSEGYEVVCFGGRHEREFVPRSRAFDMSFTAPDLGLRMTPSLKKALDEAEEYKANQSAHDRSSSVVTKDVNLTLSRSAELPTSDSMVSRQTKFCGRRRAGSKYESTSTESSMSTQPAHWKRRKPALSSISSHGGKKSKRESTSPSANSSSAGSCANLIDVHHVGPIDPKGNSRKPPCNDDGIASAEQNLKTHRGDNSDPNIFHASAMHKGSDLFPTVSKTVIRIKPLPPPKDDPPPTSFPINRRHTSYGLSRDRTCTKLKIKPSASSSSSALSGVSSGCATVPADTSSLDGPVCTLSSLSSVSSLSSSSRSRNRSKRLDRLSRRNTADSGLHADCHSHDTENLKAPSVQQTDQLPIPSSVQLTDSSNPPCSSRAIFYNHSPHLTRSSSPLSSLCDSDSSDSSAFSHSTSPSSELSSSSPSTIPSPSRISSFSNHPMGPQNLSIHNRSRNMSVPKFRGSKPLRTKAAPPVKLLPNLLPDHSVSSEDDHNSDLTPPNASDRCNQTPQPYISPTCSEPRWDLNHTGKQNVSKNSDSLSISPRRLSSQLSNFTGQNALVLNNGAAKFSNATLCTTSWPTLNRLSAHFGSQTPTSHLVSSSNSTLTSTGPTPPSYSLSSSSCYSSVSPAALSTTSGLGSSLSDPKSVDASPGEVAVVLGSAAFSCSSNGHSTSQSVAMHSDSALIKSTEEQIHRIYADRLIALTAERDHAREELARRDCLIAKLRREHEAEVRRIKQMTWCQVCLNEAFYHCCPGTAYCSETCQLRHWTDQHNRDCRRRGETR
ncbi:unnamed protein product [Dicrocoelium dendriticum]|nr:unnamed protein product [Dicrocoelium dendriticum]